ncbi:MAG: ribosomal protein S18-alanine N-acetyltransferase [Alphaproteobacteria bacterium]|nr:ribosomal protein S18-alanine N-acetyltransferase [Alphaproteobacteria bacterium]
MEKNPDITPFSARPAGPSDVPALAELHAQSFAEGRWSSGQIAASLASPEAFAFLAQKEGAACGFILCRAAAGEAEILTFCVIPSVRRHGAGAALLSAAQKESQRRKASRLFLEVAADNAAAKALYEKAGFCVAGVRAKYYARQTGSVDALTMALEIPPA